MTARSPVRPRWGRGLLGLSDTQWSLCTLCAHSPPPCTGVDTEAEGSVVSRPLALAPCSALYRGGQDPGSALPDPCPPAAPGAFCSGASEARPCPPGDAAGAQKIGGPQPPAGLRNPCLLACPLQERGLGWGCVHPRTADPGAGSQHPKAPQRECLLGPDGLGSSLGFLLCLPRRLVAG